MQNLAPGIWVLAHSSVSPWRPQHREKGALLRTSSAWSTCDLGRGGRRGERASSDQRLRAGECSVGYCARSESVSCLRPSPQEGECGGVVCEGQDPRMPILPGGRAAIARRASVGLRGLFGAHFSEATAGGIFGMVRPQLTLGSNRRVSTPEHMARATGWACATEVTRMQQGYPSPEPWVLAKEWLFHAPGALA